MSLVGRLAVLQRGIWASICWDGHVTMMAVVAIEEGDNSGTLKQRKTNLQWLKPRSNLYIHFSFL